MIGDAIDFVGAALLDQGKEVARPRALVLLGAICGALLREGLTPEEAADVFGVVVGGRAGLVAAWLDEHAPACAECSAGGSCRLNDVGEEFRELLPRPEVSAPTAGRDPGGAA